MSGLNTDAPGELLPLAEVIHRSAEDTLFFGRVFFPKTFKKGSPEFHEDMSLKLDLRGNKVFKVFRDGAKTTLTRVFTAKRISFGISDVIIVVGKGQDHAIKTLLWIKNQILTNRKWTETFQLSPAMKEGGKEKKKWTDEWFTIWSGVAQKEIHLIAFGITGQIRGVNIDDCRPDFIICDDILDDENCATVEQREKIKDRFYGALMNSLTEVTENPDASAVMLQTPIDQDDLCEELCGDPDWISAAYSCFDEQGMSRWEERKPTEMLLARKAAAIRRNKLSIWMREMEVTIVSRELSAFLPEWLVNNFWETPLPSGGFFLLSVDPTPPPKETERRNLEKLDDAVVMVTYFWQGHLYLIEYYTQKSPQISEIVSKVFEFYLKYKPLKVGVETVLFARAIKSAIEVEMHRQRVFFTVTPVEDRRNKNLRIMQTIEPLASNGKIHVRPEHTQFISQFNRFPQLEHDDVIDAFSIAITLINPAMLAIGDVLEGEYSVVDESEYDDMEFGGAP